MVLGVLAATGMVVALLASYALERALLAETRGAESRSGVGGQLAGAIEAGVGALSAFEEVAEGGLHHPSEGWGRPADMLSGWPAALEGVEVEVFDESSRPGLSLLDEDQLQAILEELGLSKAQASELRDLLLDWMDEDDDQRIRGRENSDLGRQRDPWVANRPPQNWDEVWGIPEWGEEAFDEDGELLPWARQFSSMFSLDHDRPANINSADAATVEWLGEAGLLPYPDWLDRRKGVDNVHGTADDRILRELPGGDDDRLGELFSAESQVLRVRASMRVGQRYVWKEAWIAKERDGNGRSGPDRGRDSGGGRNTGEASPWGSWSILDVREGLSLVLDETEE